uniref:Potassium channel domain-containing protein n=1 Tax=viral metagenome TaxID=1070528 RepID=A0A6C0KY04_9ZZZZ
MKNILRFNLLMLQIVIFSVLYLFLDDSHFSGINTLEEMIRTELIQRKIDPIIEKEVAENFENSENQKKEIEKTAEKITKNLEKTEVIESLTKPSLFDKFFKRLYFSFVTGTTLGYGDIFPNSTICKTITIIQLVTTILLLIA